MTQTIARRLSERVAAAWEGDGGDYLDPELAALCEAFFFSRNPPLSRRASPTLEGMEEAPEGAAVSGKPLCASVAGFSLHAAQAVAPWDREALERLLRYGLRAPFSQERLFLQPDGKVLYRLRRPWPNKRGASMLILDPLDFLRRLAALVSYPYAHQVRYHGVFANRSRMRPLLPPPPAWDIPGIGPETAAQPALELHSHKRVEAGAGGEIATPPRCRPRLAWAQLLRRVLHVDALRCPRCSTSAHSAPMEVLAFLTDPEVVGKILRHLGLPSCAPALAPARVASWGLPSGHLPPPVPCADGGVGQGEVGPAWPVCSEESESRGDHGDAPPPIRPPP